MLLPALTILKPAEARWASSLPAALNCASPAGRAGTPQVHGPRMCAEMRAR